LFLETTNAGMFLVSKIIVKGYLFQFLSQIGFAGVRNSKPKYVVMLGRLDSLAKLAAATP